MDSALDMLMAMRFTNLRFIIIIIIIIIRRLTCDLPSGARPNAEVFVRALDVDGRHVFPGKRQEGR